jgi:hypothetical protein
MFAAKGEDLMTRQCHQIHRPSTILRSSSHETEITSTSNDMDYGRRTASARNEARSLGCALRNTRQGSLTTNSELKSRIIRSGAWFLLRHSLLVAVFVGVNPIIRLISSAEKHQ